MSDRGGGRRVGRGEGGSDVFYCDAITYNNCYGDD
ncbi:MAG: hypothetical protein UW94_C0005G0022 [Parcubacteria group bacterium GW2011_GWA2_45_14]|nr:MAG: hypothetical protein UW94_C0005G0022 [Parcubacteria group bacterium GW2011_GWA2_45_14]